MKLDVAPGNDRVLTPEAIAFLGELHERFGARRLELVEPADWEICCGSAGIYNLLQPEPAAELGRRKAANLQATGAEAIAAANPGCALQIAAYMDGPVPIHHPMTLLDHAIRGSRP